MVVWLGVLGCEPDAIPLDPDVAVDSTAAPSDGPTWYADVAPIIGLRCAGCHVAGDIAAFRPFGTYAETAPWAGSIAAAVVGELPGVVRMPPYQAAESDDCAFAYPLEHDNALSDDEIAVLRAWAEAGAPEGDPATAASVPEPITPTLPDGIAYDNPADHAVAPTESGDQFYCFVIDPELTEDQFVTGFEVLADDRTIVHHANIYVDYARESLGWLADDAPVEHGPGWYACGKEIIPGVMSGAYVPGSPPIRTPEGTAFAVPAGSLYVLQIHYYYADLTGDPKPDDTAIRVRYADDPTAFAGHPERIVRITTPGNFTHPAPEGGTGIVVEPGEEAPYFSIPPHATAHREVMQYRMPGSPADVYTYAITGNHMHQHGVEAVLRNLTTGECYVRTPDWSFEWQMDYRFDATKAPLPVVHGGDLFELTCTFANDGDEPVLHGESSTEEMCSFFLGVTGFVDTPPAR